MGYLIVLSLIVLAIGACGGLKIQAKIVGGSVARIGQFPYQISIKLNDNHICGGSIIHANVILTAAHCVYQLNYNQMKVMPGSNKIDANVTHYPVQNAIGHENYHPRLMRNDIGLLILESQIPYDSMISSIGLDSNFIGGNVICTLSGWGLTASKGLIPTDLQMLNLKTITHSECAKKFPVGNPPVTMANICTLSNKGQGACRGDSGGPLVANHKQIGVVSYGIPCAQGVPDVYTRVSAFIQWIETEVAPYLN